MALTNLPDAEVILNSLNDGLYVCDRERRIVFWSKSAERITGWKADEVVGLRCLDNVLSHVDQDGRPLCGEAFCPLYRSMVTDSASNNPLIVFGLTKNRGRIPMTVSVAPIHDPEGQVVGGVELFHDFTETYANLERARRIQTLSLDKEFPRDERVGFSSFYLPQEMIGGDYFAVHPLDADRYGFLLADVMGHGIAAALHTMHLSALWGRRYPALGSPAKFAKQLNQDLCKVVKDESFATAICGIIDAAQKTVSLVSAGGPAILLVRADGTMKEIDATGLPFGMIDGADYDQTTFSCASGDALLMFTDGIVEIQDAAGGMLGTDGLMAILKDLDYPARPIEIEPLHRALLSFSSGIRLQDDLTLLEVRFT